MFKPFFLFAFLGAFSLTTWAQVDLINKVADNGSDSVAGFEFELLIDLEATPVKNQGRSGTCWSYATTGFLESELLRRGKPAIDLAEMFTVRMVYRDKAEKYVRLHGHLNFAQGGALPDVLYVLRHYGALPQEVYPGLNYGTEVNNHGELEAVLKAYLDQVIKNENGHLSSSWIQGLEGILDAYLGPIPTTFAWEGKSYTPRSFADDYLGLKADDYLQLSSLLHHPLYEQFIIQVPDNWAWGTCYNVALDEMMAAIDHSLAEGYTVSWATDVSEAGFSLKNGLALVVPENWSEWSKEEREAFFNGSGTEPEISPAMRQAAYDNYRTTDDHGMQITGKAKDQRGRVFYLVKNSWGERENEHRPGYLYVSEAFVRYKTIGILLHRKAVPKPLQKKLKL